MLPTTTTTTTESSKEDPELCELFDTTSDDHVPEDTVLGIVEEHVKETDGRISAIQDVQDETDVIMRGLEADMNSRFATVFLAIDSLKRDFDSLKRENTELRSKIVALERALENSSSPPKPSFKEAALAEKPKKPSVSRKKPSRFSERKVEFRLKLEELFGMIGFEPNGFRIVSPQTLKPSKAQIERIIENFNLGDISPDATYQLGANMLDFVLVGGERLPFNVVTRGVNNCSLIPKGMKTVFI